MPQTPSGALFEIEAESYTRVRFVMPDDSVSFVAKPVKVRTRKGKDYHVLRVTIPKDVAKSLAVSEGDFLLLRAKVAQWFHLLDWSEMPDVWQRLPLGLQTEVIRSNLPHPTSSKGIASPTSATGLVAATESTVAGSTAVSQ